MASNTDFMNLVAQGYQAQTGNQLNWGGGTSNTTVDVQPGLDYQYEVQAQALQKYIADQQNSLSRELFLLNQAASERLAAEDRRLQSDLLNKRIDADKYIQARELKQRESEAARQFAIQRLQSDRAYEIDKATLELNKLQQQMQERETLAKLSANPTDWIAYQFYTRGLGTPEAYNQASQVATGADQQILGGPGTPAPVSDTSIQDVARSIQNPDQAGYNPDLKGTSAFGAELQSPNTLSRNNVLQLSDTELQMLTGLIQAGIDINGKRVAVNPADYFQQAENSWIPTLSSVAAPTQYS